MKITLPVIDNVIGTDEMLELDVSEIDMAQFKDSVRAVFVYLRNSGLDGRISFNFAGCPYKTKEKWMLEYVQGDIDLNLKDLNAAWVKVMLTLLSVSLATTQSVLSDKEIQQLISQNRTLVEDLVAVCKSTMFWVAEHMAKSTGLRDFETFFKNVDDVTKLAPTFSNIILQNIKAIEFITLNDVSFPVCEFKQCFTESQSSKLVQGLHSSSVVFMLFGSRTPQWKQLMTIMSNVQPDASSLLSSVMTSASGDMVNPS